MAAIKGVSALPSIEGRLSPSPTHARQSPARDACTVILSRSMIGPACDQLYDGFHSQAPVSDPLSSPIHRQSKPG